MKKQTKLVLCPCVYFICAGEFVKIGTAVDPKRRIKLLQTGCPTKYEILHLIYVQNRHLAVEIEKELHEELKNVKFRGEWYSKETIDALLEGDKIERMFSHLDWIEAPKTGISYFVEDEKESGIKWRIS